ncbi:MAG: helicase, partial [Rhizobiales bacterium]|nr:helicase [Hyphomicrobiales bacterium]
KALAGEIERRAEKIGNAPNPEFLLSTDGTLRWLGAPVARIVATDDALRPRLILLADEGLTGPARERVQDRVDIWLKSHIETLLKPLFELLAGVELSGPARGIAFRLVEGQGVLERSELAEEIKALDQEARSGLRKLGVRFGAYHIYVPALLKPAPSALNAMLWALKNQGLDAPGLIELPQLSATGRTTVPVDPSFARPLYRVVGYRIAGNRAVRIDILERLADIIRPLIAWKPTSDNLVPPEGAVDGNGFTVTVAMTSLLGCSGEDFAGVLKSLGYRLDRRPAPPKAAPVAEEAAPAVTVVSEETVETTETVTEEAPAAETETTTEETVETTVTEAGTETTTEAETAEEATEADATPVVEAPSLETGDAEPAVPAEPEMIDVWRPGRFDRRPQQRDHRRDRRPQHGASAEAGAGEAKPEGRDGGRGRQQDGERDGRRQGGRP